MIRIGKQLKCRARPQVSYERLQKGQVCELISISLQKQHGDLDVEQVLAPLV